MNVKIDCTIIPLPGSHFPTNHPYKNPHEPIFDTQATGRNNSQEFKELFNRLPTDLFSGMDFRDEEQGEAAGPLFATVACKPAHDPNASCKYEPPVSTTALNQDMVGADALSKTMDYLAKSVNQLIKGNWTEDVTLLGTCAQVGTGLLGLDLPADIRDLTYDLTHWQWSWGHAGRTLLDAAGLLPLVGALKYGDEAAALAKGGSKNLDEAAGLAAKLNHASDTGTGLKAKIPWKYGDTGGALGTTDKFGNITIRPGLSGQVLDETVRHESVHRFFSPKRGPLKEIRADIGMAAYQNSHLVRYLEEAAAEAFATGSLRQGVSFPLSHNYVSAGRLSVEAAGFLGATGSAAYFGYKSAAGEDQ